MIQNRSSRVITVLGGVLAIGILSNLFTMGSSAVQPLKIGDVVPDLVLSGSDGESHSLRKFVAGGEGLVIAWIPRTGTPG